MLLTEWNWNTALEVSKEEGFEKGVGNERLRTARAMKDKGFDIHTIVEVTELPIDVVLNL